MQNSFPKQLAYLNSKQALVQTQSMNTWKELYQQRIRWAKKTSSLSNILIKVVGVGVLLANFTLILLFIIGFIDSLKWIYFIVFLVLKIIIDSLLLYRTAANLHQKTPFITWLFSSLLYPFFSVSVVVLGLFTNYRWKGREFDK